MTIETGTGRGIARENEIDATEIVTESGSANATATAETATATAPARRTATAGRGQKTAAIDNAIL